jgi:ribosomal protein S18 acetylase RimI-like enzyme
VTPSDDIQVRPASPGEARRAADIVARHGGTPGGADPGDSLLYSSLQNAAVAAQGDDLLGLCVYVPSEGRCTAVLVPRLVEWDEALAARLIRVTSALARKRHDARLIQTLLAPDLPRPITAAYERAGFEPLAELAYMRRAMRPEDGRAATVADLEWRGYSFFRRGEFARAIAASYIDSLDCPRLAGLRTVGDALATHKATGIFSPKTWHVARQGGEPVGVELINNLSGRGELVYLGVAAGARGRGIGRALLERAIADTAALGLPQMGLAVDVANTPAMRLYEHAGFKEIRRRIAWFVPKERLEEICL